MCVYIYIIVLVFCKKKLLRVLFTYLLIKDNVF